MSDEAHLRDAGLLLAPVGERAHRDLAPEQRARLRPAPAFERHLLAFRGQRRSIVAALICTSRPWTALLARSAPCRTKRGTSSGNWGARRFAADVVHRFPHLLQGLQVGGALCARTPSLRPAPGRPSTSTPRMSADSPWTRPPGLKSPLLLLRRPPILLGHGLRHRTSLLHHKPHAWPPPIS